MTHLRTRLLTVLPALLIVTEVARAQFIPANAAPASAAPATITRANRTPAPGTPAPGGTGTNAASRTDTVPAVWNSPRALELVERARVRRAVPRADSGLVNYQATAAGYVYFFLDRTDSEERNLVRVDQLALEVFWAAPNRTKQRIIGMRDASKLPNRMQYHLDHLTVVQDEFGDLIRLGDGDEVRDVLHPAAPGSESTYDFRLVDSLTIRLSGSASPIHVHEIEVRPRDPDRPAFVGSIYLDQTTAAIVRMNFTFTPASYVDRRLDYIRVGLDNGLWEGRYWLPNEQTLEIRRQVPVLDFPAGSVIRGVLRISDYRFNQELPPNFFWGARVVAAPREAREAHEFPSEIFAEVDDEGLSTSADLDALRRQAIGMIGSRYLSGLPKLRLYLPNSSAAFRYNRAEALYLGGGLSYATGAASRLRLTTGYATGPGHLSLSGEWRLDVEDATAVWLRAERHALRDLGLRPGLPGALNTIAAAGFGEDFLDPYFASGATLGLQRRLGKGWRAELGGGYERHRTATMEVERPLFGGDAAFRPIRDVAEGPLVNARLALGYGESHAPGWSGTATLEVGRFDGATYFRPTVEGALRHRTVDQRTGLELRGAAGFITGSAPRQALFLLGGSGTIPGYEYRAFAGDRFALLGLEAHHDLVYPWLRARAVAAAGWTDLRAAPTPTGWSTHPTPGLLTSVGAGLGLFYDLIRLDVVRGLHSSGRWQWVVSVTPALADIL